MASEAEVDLVISTAGALPELQDELQRIIAVAEAGAPDVELEATMDRRNAVADLLGDLDAIVRQTEAAFPGVELTAELDTLETLEDLLRELDNVIDIAEDRAATIQLDAELDANIAALDAELAAITAELEAEADDIEIDVDVDRDGRGRNAIAGIARGISGMLPGLGRAAAGIGGIGAAAGSAAPLLAGLVTSLESVAPAAALAVSGLLTVQLASGTLKLAMQGVGEAITTAFDPEAKPEDLAKAMEQLSPRARSFVTELSKMKSEFKAIQQGVQENFFQGFAGALHQLSDATLPDVKEALFQASGELNAMALGAVDAATRMGKNGTLGVALDGSRQALQNLNAVPGQIVTGLLQIAAAATPAFGRITAAAGGAATEISDRLEKAFDSGALEKAIDRAVEALKQLGRIAGNIFGGLGNIIDGFQTQGDGLFGTLEKITQAFEDVTATQGFQDALKALSQTMSVIATTVLPIISQAIQALGPIFQALAGPVQSLVKTLGGALTKIVTALGPVLVSLANVFGKLVEAAAPIIDLFGTLVAAILPALTPLFNALARVFFEITPFIEQLAKNLATQLLPIFTTLATDVLPKILPPFIELATKIFPILTQILVELGPALAKLGETFGNLLSALAPVIVAFLELELTFLEKLMPVIQPLIDLLLKLIEGGLGIVVNFINGIVVPALTILADLLEGDFSAAWQHAKDLIKDMAEKATEFIIGFVDGVQNQLIRLARWIGQKVLEIKDDFVAKIRQMGEDSIADVKSLPDRVAGALAGVGTALLDRGRQLVQGFIDGIASKLGELRSIASEIANVVSGGLAGALDIHSPSRVMMEMGEDTMQGFLDGMAAKLPDLRADLQGIASVVPSFALPNGQTLALPQLNPGAPVVQVYLGNELINAHVDSRITQSNQARDRLMIQGVRR